MSLVIDITPNKEYEIVPLLCFPRRSAAAGHGPGSPVAALEGACVGGQAGTAPEARGGARLGPSPRSGRCPPVVSEGIVAANRLVSLFPFLN